MTGSRCTVTYQEGASHVVRVRVGRVESVHRDGSVTVLLSAGTLCRLPAEQVELHRVEAQP